ncbi:hypothetical protein BSKO_13672 [Bryopsis sp. KO-2023]|nr:hypothetical protein BSKO_13672 [Bryopsis sp. KO-2023]
MELTSERPVKGSRYIERFYNMALPRPKTEETKAYLERNKYKKGVMFMWYTTIASLDPTGKLGCQGWRGRDFDFLVVDHAAAPSESAIPIEVCGASDLDVMFSLETDAAGYVAIVWPGTHGVMIGADVVIAVPGGEDGPEVGGYKLRSKSMEGILPSDAIEISDAAI